MSDLNVKSNNSFYTDPSMGLDSTQQVGTETAPPPVKGKSLQKDTVSHSENNKEPTYDSIAADPTLQPPDAKSQPEQPRNLNHQTYDPAEVQADYNTQLNQNISKYATDHSLSDTDTALLLAAASNPSDPAMLDNIKAMLNQIVGDTTTSIIAKYHLSETWKPTPPTVVDPKTISNNATAYLNDVKSILDKYANNLPDGPGKIILANYLKAIGEAISKLQEEIARMEEITAEGRKGITESQKEAMDLKVKIMLDALAEQAKQMAAIAAEQAKKAHKGGIFAKVMKVLVPIIIALSVVATIASLGTAGPAAIALNVALLSLTVADAAGAKIKINGKEMSPSAFVMGAIGTAVGAIVKASGGSEKSVMAAEAYTNMAVAVIALAAGKGGPSGIMASTQIFTQSNAIQGAMIASGTSPEKAAMIAGIVNAAVMMMGMVGAAASAKASKMEDAAKMVEKISDTTTKINRISSTVRWIQAAKGPLTTAQKIKVGAKLAALMMQRACQRGLLSVIQEGNQARTAVNFVTGVTRGGESYVTYQNAIFDRTIENLRGDLESMKGKADAGDLVMQTLIDSLKAMLKKLLEILDSLVTFTVDVNKMDAKVVDQMKVDYALPS